LSYKVIQKLNELTSPTGDASHVMFLLSAEIGKALLGLITFVVFVFKLKVLGLRNSEAPIVEVLAMAMSIAGDFEVVPSWISKMITAIFEIHRKHLKTGLFHV
jgi:hypothetical protein